MVFNTTLGEWTCLGRSSLKYIDEHFHDEFFEDDTGVLKRILKKILDDYPTAVVYPAYQETEDGYHIRLNTTKTGSGTEYGILYVPRCKKVYKPFDIKSIYEELDEEVQR